MTDKSTHDNRFEIEALRWLPNLARYALSLTRSETDADDLVQDTFLMACQQWHQFVPGTECRAWLFTICRHRYYRTRQRDDRQVATETPELESLAAAAVHAGARSAGLDDAFAQTSVLEAVDTAMANLPSQFRDVAILVDIEDQSYETTAQILGVPIGTVRSRLFRARRILQETLLIHAQDAGIVVAKKMSPQSEEMPMRDMAMRQMIDCDGVMRQLWDYLDGELNEQTMQAIRDHLEMCSRCQPQLEFERSFLEALARARREHSNTAVLADRVRKALHGQGFNVI